MWASLLVRGSESGVIDSRHGAGDIFWFDGGILNDVERFRAGATFRPAKRALIFDIGRMQRVMSFDSRV
jgi:hypothetical protein